MCPHLKILWHGVDNSAGTVKAARTSGKQKKRLNESINEWTRMGFGDFPRAAEDSESWTCIVSS